MFVTFLLLPLSLPAPGQESPEVPGAYRGPDQERTLGLDPALADSSLLQFAQRRAGWESWFEHERELLFRGEPDFPARALGEDGRYGDGEWSIRREELLLSALPLLIEALGEGDPALREAAAIALGRIGYPASESLLTRALDDAHLAVRQAACLGLGLLASDGAEEALRRIFEDRALDATQRGFAALGLGLSGRSGGGSALKIHLNGVLSGPSEIVEPLLTQAVVIAAGVHGSRDFLVQLMELDERLAEDGGSDRLRASIFQALGALQDERAVARLTAALADGDGELGRAAAQALARLRAPTAVLPLAAKARASHDPETRALCAIAIGRIGGNRAVEELKLLQPGKGAEDQARAGWLIGCGLARCEAGYARLEEALDAGAAGAARASEASARRGDESVRGAAAIGLGLFRNPQSIAAFERLLEDPAALEPGFAGQAFAALGMLQLAEAEELLLELAARSGEFAPEARRGLAIGLGLCSTERSALELARLLVRDPSAEVRWAGARALSYARSNDALRVVVEELRDALEQKEIPASAPHLVLGLGFLGDLHQGATLDGLVAGMDFLQESRLLETLRSY